MEMEMNEEEKQIQILRKLHEITSEIRWLDSKFENYKEKQQWEKENKHLSDGSHTFDELYQHRYLLFMCLMTMMPALSWRANNHHDGSNYDGYFIAGIHWPTGAISYHIPIDKWELLDNHGIKTTNKAPFFDGHNSDDVLNRLTEFLIRGKQNG